MRTQAALAYFQVRRFPIVGVLGKVAQDGDGQTGKITRCGDLTGDGDIGFADFLVLSTNFGKQANPIEHTFEPTQQNLEGVEALFALRDRLLAD